MVERKGNNSIDHLPTQNPLSIYAIGSPTVVIERNSPAERLLGDVDKHVIPVLSDLSEHSKVVIDGSFALFLYGLSQGKRTPVPKDVDILATGQVGERRFLEEVARRYRDRVGDRAISELRENPRDEKGPFNNDALSLGLEGSDLSIDILTRKNTRLPDSLLKPEMRGLVSIDFHTPTKGSSLYNLTERIGIKGIGPDYIKTGQSNFYFDIIHPFWLRAYYLSMGRAEDQEKLQMMLDLGLINHTDSFFPTEDELQNRHDRSIARDFKRLTPLQCTLTPSYDALKNTGQVTQEVQEALENASRNPLKVPELLRFYEDFPDREYMLLPGDILSHEKQQLQRNQEFVENLILDRMKNSDPALTAATTEITKYIMASVDRNYGDGSNNPGRKYLDDPSSEKSIPMFYHNGESLRIVLEETVNIMKQDIQAKGEASAYYDPKIFMATIIAAGAADLISDKQRGVEERDTAELMRNILSLDLWGYDFSREMVMLPNEQGEIEEKSMTDAIADAVIATTFNEEELTQQGGGGPIAKAVLDGDLAILFRRDSTKKAMDLMLEDTWREATATLWGRQLREAAMREGFVGTAAKEFAAFMDKQSQRGMPSPLAELASKYLVRNIEFIHPEGKMKLKGPKGHTYKIDFLNSERIKQQRRDNAQLQWTVGVLIGMGQLSLVDAYAAVEEYSQSDIPLEQFLDEKDLRVYGLAA